MQLEELNSNIHIKNIDKINKIKREKVKNILNNVEKNNSEKMIKKIIIFGSSTRFDCREDSDIDICIVTNENMPESLVIKFVLLEGSFSEISKNKCDIINYKFTDDYMKNMIKETGVCVYEL